MIEKMDATKSSIFASRIWASASNTTYTKNVFFVLVAFLHHISTIQATDSMIFFNFLDIQ